MRGEAGKPSPLASTYSRQASAMGVVWADPPLPSEEGTIEKVVSTCTRKPGPESGLACLICSISARH